MKNNSQLQLLILVFLISSIRINAQKKDSIVLPNSSKEIKFNVPVQVLDIYATANQEIWFNNEKLTYFNQVFENLSKAMRDRPKGFPMTEVYLYAHKDLNYNFISDIKQSVSKASTFIIYKTDDADLIKGIKNKIRWINGFPNRPNEIVDLKTLQKRKKYSDSITGNLSKNSLNLSPPPPPPSFIEYEFANALYSYDECSLEKMVKTISSVHVEVLPEKKIIIDGIKYEFDEVESNEALVRQVILVTFDSHLLYSEYIDYLVFLEELKSKFKEKGKRLGFVIEIEPNLAYNISALNLGLFRTDIPVNWKY